MRQHPMTVEHALNQNFQLAARSLLAKQACRNHPGIVKHHQITRTQMFKQISKLTMCQRPALPIQGQQATVAALRQRMACDERIREFESKVSNAHDRFRLAGPGSLTDLVKIDQ